MPVDVVGAKFKNSNDFCRRQFRSCIFIIIFVSSFVSLKKN